MATFKGYQIKGIDIENLPEVKDDLVPPSQYSIRLLLEPIEEAVEIGNIRSKSSTEDPASIWKYFFTSECGRRQQTLTNRVRSHQRNQGISINLYANDEFHISVQGSNIATIEEHSQFFIDLVDSVNKQTLSKIEKNVQEKEEKEKANEVFREQAEQINAECFPGIPTPESCKK